MKQWSIDLSQWSHVGRGGGVLDIENLASGMWGKVKYRGGNSGVFISVSGVGGGVLDGDNSARGMGER